MSLPQDETGLQDDLPEGEAGQGDPPPYQYKLLKSPRSIRILHLYAAESYGSPLRVRLFDISLDDTVPFIALSYAWATEDEDADASLTCPVICAPDELSINVTQNCDAALRRIREQSGEDGNLLWVDAISIDQDDVDERNVQVPLMKDIYKQAQKVILWIGEASDVDDPETGRPVTDTGIEFIEKFAQEIEDLEEAGQTPDQGKCYQEVIAFHQRDVHTISVLGLWMIFQRRWWKRVWVIQEVAIPAVPVLLCGKKVISFTKVSSVIRALLHNEPGSLPGEVEINVNLVSNALPHFFMRNYMQVANSSPRSEADKAPGAKVQYILKCTATVCASDPRDMIYGILGFFGDPDSDPENILPRPDYSRSVVELYADVTRAIIMNTRSLAIMSGCYSTIETNPGLPSWAKSYDQTTPQYFDYNTFNAAHNTRVAYGDCTVDLAIRIQGVGIDTLTQVIDLPFDDFTYGDLEIVTIWRQWVEVALSLESYPTGEDLQKVLLETLCWSSNVLHYRLAPDEYQESFHAFLEFLTSNESLESIAERIFEDELAADFCRRARRIMIGRQLARTSKSYIALVPMMTLVDDQIVIFSGGRVPFVVRETGDTFKLVGPCYIHGIMDGEAFPKGQSDAENLDWFTLC
ncbi:heterokaryon incompatibility protein [Phlyctema vagabunda]|uniref:Heterokaryon incompatibility protein n=1 Tax=Phlyctema vagabunda TaxID=108571 RepID=A0ABR4PHW0_9HELO